MPTRPSASSEAYDPYAERARFYVRSLVRIGRIISDLGALPPEPMEAGAVAAAALARIAFIAEANPDDPDYRPGAADAEDGEAP